MQPMHSLAMNRWFVCSIVQRGKRIDWLVPTEGSLVSIVQYDNIDEKKKATPKHLLKFQFGYVSADN